MLQWVDKVDHAFLTWLGRDVFDHYGGWVTRNLTEPTALILALAVVAFVLVMEKRKLGLKIMLHVFFSVSVTNFFASSIIKNKVQRQRPCVTAPSPHFATSCSSLSSSFPSSHAANSMAVAATALHYHPIYGGALVAVSVVTGLSRLYLGVHFPSDVFTGWALGAFLSWLIIWLTRFFRRQFGLYSPSLK